MSNNKKSILVGSDAFMKRLEKVSASSSDFFYVQAMTFEGDNAGRWLIDLMKASPARDKKLLIDSYSKFVINDHFIYSPFYLRNRAFRKEVGDSKRLVQEAKESGVEVAFTNPLGIFGYRYPLRNHKKMVVTDTTAFIGGINFSEHNFSWHDMMIAMEGELVNPLKHDFISTWNGKNQSLISSYANTALYFLNGAKSKEEYQLIFQHLVDAKSSIEIISPYVSNPLLDLLMEISNKVEVTIYIPEENNKSIFNKLLEAASAKSKIKCLSTPGMSHLKAIMIDRQRLIFGSSNFDLISFYFEQEVVAVSHDSQLILDFTKEILSPLINNSNLVEVTKTSKPVLFSMLELFCNVAHRTIWKVK